MRSGPVLGLVGQGVLLAALAATAGLSAAGWLVGAAFGLVLYALLARHHLGPADLVTLTRATLVGGVTALIAGSLDHAPPVGLLVGLTTVALALDAVDGKVARRTRTESAFGARFDLEVDAFLILVLSVYVAGALGLWVLAIGAMRYVFVAAAWVLPWMREALPPRYWRKVAAAAQGIALTVAAANLLPPTVNVVLVAVALGLLIESFVRDVWWLRRRAAARFARPAVCPGDGGT